MEEWKNIESFEGYQVSNEGRVKNSKGKILKPQKNSCGYLRVQLWEDGKQVMKFIHRLVAEAFIPNPQNLLEVNHKDENPSRNEVSNLEWCDKKYNVNYGTRNQRSGEKLTNHPTKSKRVDQIDPITGEIVHRWASTQECARNGFNHGAVAACARGLYKQYKGYIWKYAPM